MKYTPPASPYSEKLKPAKPHYKSGDPLRPPKNDTWATGWVILVIVLLVLIRALGYAALSILLFIENALMFNKAIPPALMWAVLGAFAGLVCGSWIAMRKYRLNFKITGVSLAMITIFITAAISVNKPLQTEAQVQTLEYTVATPWVSVISSESLPAYLNYTYTADNLLDSLDDTAWMFRSSADTNFVTFIFNKAGTDELPRLTLTGFKIKNGYNKSRSKWNIFNRIKGINVLHNSSQVGELTASDLYNQEENLSLKPFSIQKGDTIRLNIKSVYTGKKNNFNSAAVTRLVPIVSYAKF